MPSGDNTLLEELYLIFAVSCQDRSNSRREGKGRIKYRANSRFIFSYFGYNKQLKWSRCASKGSQAIAPEFFNNSSAPSQ